MDEAIFEASAHSSSPGGGAAAADTFLDVSGADFIIEQEVGQSKHAPHPWLVAANGPVVIELDQSFRRHQPFGQEPLQGALTVDNHFSFVNAMPMEAP